MSKLVLGTRGSKLALAQSQMMAARLRAAHPGLEVELRVISTKGDRVLDVALSAVGDKGLFVKELEQALMDHEVDLCVHSCKDLPSVIPDGLTIAAFPERADPRDVLIRSTKAAGSRQQAAWETVTEDSAFSILHAALRVGAVVGTSSLRRACQLRALRPDLELRDVRGNVDTRLRKLAEGQYEALVLATAGVVRLGLLGPDGRLESDGHTFVAYPIPTELMLPAVTQGTLAIECRADDTTTVAILAALDHGPTRVTALAERAFLRRLEGGCQVPIAAHAACSMQPAACATLHLRGMVGSLDGATVVRGEQTSDLDGAEALGTALAEELLARGAGEILAELRATTP